MVSRRAPIGRPRHPAAFRNTVGRVSTRLPAVSGPIHWKQPSLDEPMERRVRPVRYPAYMAMLHRIEMDVVDTRAQMRLVANQPLPVSSRPYAAFTLDQAAFGDSLAAGNSTREVTLDVAPACGVVVVTLRQAPNAVQMVGQDHPRQKREGFSLAGCLERIPEDVDMIDEQSSSSLQQGDRECKGSAGNPEASVVGHEPSIACAQGFRYRRIPGRSSDQSDSRRPSVRIRWGRKAG